MLGVLFFAHQSTRDEAIALAEVIAIELLLRL